LGSGRRAFTPAIAGERSRAWAPFRAERAKIRRAQFEKPSGIIVHRYTKRTVRKEGTVRIDSQLYEVDLYGFQIKEIV
jgi:hypothetical protein